MTKNKEAQSLGKLGGLATAKRGSNYYKRISKLGVAVRKKNREAKKLQG